MPPRSRVPAITDAHASSQTPKATARFAMTSKSACRCRTIAYTGDTACTDSLADACAGADLLIAEAYYRDKNTTRSSRWIAPGQVAHLSAAGPAAPNHLSDTGRMVGVPRRYEQQISKPIEVNRYGGNRAFGLAEGGNSPFGMPTGTSRDMQRGSGGRTAGKDEVPQLWQGLPETIDCILHLLDVLLG